MRHRSTLTLFAVAVMTLWRPAAPTAADDPFLLQVRADETGILLHWRATGALTLEASVYRRTDRIPWKTLGAPDITGPDELSYEDPAVVPGVRYAYRLGYVDGGMEHFTDEVWVEAPVLVFAVRGFQPNPAAGLPTVSLTLTSAAKARLELFDVSGRLVYAQDLTGLAPGRHLVLMDAVVAGLGSGIYVIRLTQGRRVAQARGVLLD